MKLTTTVKAPVLDMFSRDWEFEGKKGTAHFVVFMIMTIIQVKDL